MTTKFTAHALYAILQFAGAMSRAGGREGVATTHLAARCWERIGNTGLALEALVGRVADRCGIDICEYMITRAYAV